MRRAAWPTRESGFCSCGAPLCVIEVDLAGTTNDHGEADLWADVAPWRGRRLVGVPVHKVGHRKAKGAYRDPVRSSKSHLVKTSGLRRISMQLLAEIPWAGRVWGLPFLTVLAPSERYHLARGRRHKTLPEGGGR